MTVSSGQPEPQLSNCIGRDRDTVPYMACKRSTDRQGLRLDWNLVDLIGGMTRALVNALHGLGAGRL
jgi:hypothetical protein